MRLWPFGRRREAALHPWDLSAPLIDIAQTTFDVRMACQGVVCFGSSGAGKSSGPGDAYAKAYLKAGMGGMILLAKDDSAYWRKTFEEAGRSEDLIEFGINEAWRFNPLQWEVQRGGDGAGQTFNIVRLFGDITDVTQRDNGGRQDEKFWKDMFEMLMTNTADLLRLSGAEISAVNMSRVVNSAPMSLAQLRSEDWRAGSYCWQCMTRADKAPMSESDRSDLELVFAYFADQLCTLSEKTRSIVLSSFNATVGMLLRGALRELFSGETNLYPSMMDDGKVIMINLPVKGFGPVGQVAQVILKCGFFQRSVETRVVTADTRPIFLFSDEFQHFVTREDVMFAATCRSAKVAQFFLTQSLTGLEAALGGESSKAEIQALLGNLTTKIFTCSSDVPTNEWAANLIGRTRQHYANSSASHNGEDWAASAMGMASMGQQSAGFSESLQYQVEPMVFSSELRTGGPGNDWCVDAIVFQSGREFAATGRSWTPATFRQDTGGAR